MKRVLVLLLVLPWFAGCGGGGSSSTPPPALTPVGFLTVTGCAIPENGTTCQATVSWATANAPAATVLVGSNTVGNGANGTAMFAMGIDPVTITLRDGANTLDSYTLNGRCVATADWDGALCEVIGETFTEFAPMDDDGNPITLEIVFYKPLGAGPFPTIVFNHGSTGFGDDPDLFTETFTSAAVAQYFTRRGWVVAFPQRRGRGQSGGLYDEGFTPTRSGYSCVAAETLPGVDRALEDLDAALAYIQGHADVDATEMLSGGFSRGGILALAHAAESPGDYIGAVNFVGGWLGEGCGDHATVNRQTFLRGAPFPGDTLWIYANNDTFYTVAYSQGHFDAFITAGGQGTFEVYTRASGLNGHYIINDRSRWEADLDTYIDNLP